MSSSIFSRYYQIASFEVDGKRVLEHRPLPKAKQYPDSIRHVIVGNETLDQLAAQYYGREEFWWKIADANPNKFPLDWQPGDSLVVPPLRIATRTPRRN